MYFAGKEQLQKKQYTESAKILEQLLVQVPEHIEALYILAVCQRYLNQTERALKTLKQIQSCNPNYARAYQEEGHNYRPIDYPRAIACYEYAVQLNPALIASWQYLAVLHKATHNPVLAQEAAEQFRYWSTMPKELLSVNSFFVKEN